jgi:hypothetical protein
MLDRFLRRRDGSVRYWRLVALLGACIAMAMFGGALIWVVPSLTDDPVVRGVWVLFAIGGLKLPLVLLLWAFIRRNREWPGRNVPWSDEEVAAILDHLSRQARDAANHADASARLAYLSREAWNVADRVTGTSKVDALTVALRIDEELMQRPERRLPG